MFQPDTPAPRSPTIYCPTRRWPLQPDNLRSNPAIFISTRHTQTLQPDNLLSNWRVASAVRQSTYALPSQCFISAAAAILPFKRCPLHPHGLAEHFPAGTFLCFHSQTCLSYPNVDETFVHLPPQAKAQLQSGCVPSWRMPNLFLARLWSIARVLMYRN
jgi:hypothetical protein